MGCGPARIRDRTRVKTECEICRFVFATPLPIRGKYVKCPTCGVGTDPHHGPTSDEESSEESDGPPQLFWVWLIGSTGVFLLCCVGAIVMSQRMASGP